MTPGYWGPYWGAHYWGTQYWREGAAGGLPPVVDPMLKHLLKNDKLFVTRYRRREKVAA